MDIEKGIKKAAKKIVGEDGTQYIKGIFYIAKHRGYLNSENCMEIHTEYVEDVQVLELEKNMCLEVIMMFHFFQRQIIGYWCM